MNKKEAIAYAQIALENMLRTNDKEISLADLGMNMKSAFRLYTRDVALITADAKVYAEHKLKEERKIIIWWLEAYQMQFWKLKK